MVKFIVADTGQFSAAEVLSTKIPPEEVVFQPYFDGTNHVFFRENVFSEKEMIRRQCLTHKNLFARRTCNPIRFGGITVLPDGLVHASLHSPALGSLAEQSLGELLIREMEGGRDWLLARRRVTPCRTCVWHDLCPPVSDYERVIGRHDLCWKSSPAAKAPIG